MRDPRGRMSPWAIRTQPGCTIIRSELEIDPALCEKATRRWLMNKVDDWLFEPRGRGASSGLFLSPCFDEAAFWRAANSG